MRIRLLVVRLRTLEALQVCICVVSGSLLLTDNYAAGAVGNLANTGKQTAGAVRRGDVKGAASGLASGAGQTVAGRYFTKS
jgi:hypothetical protein